MPIRSYQRPGRPRKHEQPEMFGYRIEADLARNEAAISEVWLQRRSYRSSTCSSTLLVVIHPKFTGT